MYTPELHGVLVVFHRNKNIQRESTNFLTGCTYLGGKNRDSHGHFCKRCCGFPPTWPQLTWLYALWGIVYDWVDSISWKIHTYTGAVTYKTENERGKSNRQWMVAGVTLPTRRSNVVNCCKYIIVNVEFIDLLSMSLSGWRKAEISMDISVSVNLLLLSANMATTDQTRTCFCTRYLKSCGYSLIFVIFLELVSRWTQWGWLWKGPTRMNEWMNDVFINVW